jgi:O-antigen/teichoic acid export membrane protein
MAATNKSTTGLRRNITANMFGQGILMILSLVSTRLIFKGLGPDVLGVIYFSMTVTSVVIIMADMGVSHTITREIAANRYRDAGYVTALIGSTSVLAWSAYLLFTLVVIIAAPLLVNHWLQISKIEPSTILSFQIISASLLLAIPKTLYSSMISGYERLDLWNMANIITVGFQQLGLIAVLGWGGRLHHVALWYAISGVAGLVIVAAIAVRLSGLSAWHMSYQWPVIQKNIRFSSHLFVNSLVGYFVYQIDRWTVSKFLPVKMLGYYGVAQSLASKCSMVPGAIASAAFPALSMGVVNRERAEWRGQYNKLQDFCAYVIIPASAAVAMLGIIVIALVFNDEVMKAAWLPLMFLSVGQLLLGLQYVPYMLSIAMKKPELSLRANIRALAIVIPLAVLLTINYGLAGAALTTGIASVIHMIFFIPMFSSECLNNRARYWYYKTGLFIILGGISYGLPWSALWMLGMGLNLYGLVAAYILGTALFFISGWFVIGLELKQAISEYFSRFRIQASRKAV